jgi:predicted  nucleic acid-binding Zn-ribbon protein
MTPLNPYEAFVELSQIDQRILGLQKVVDSFNQQNEELISALDSNRRSLQEKHVSLSDAQKNLTSLELELKISLSSIMKKQKQLESSSSSREYQTLSQEINDLEQKKAELEDKILVLWQQIEELQEAYKAHAITAEEKSVLIAQNQYAINAKIAETKSQIVDLMQEAVNLQGSLNPLVLTNYLKMK